MDDINLSVRRFIEITNVGGDIDSSRVPSLKAEAMLLGTRAHQRIQKGRGEGYESEVTLRHRCEGPEYDIVISGRADGLFYEEMVPVIEEIKGVMKRVENLDEPYSEHLAQAKCYAFFCSDKSKASEIRVKMTYISLKNGQIKYFDFTYTHEELESWFNALITTYRVWTDRENEWLKKLKESAAQLSFPFSYRSSQLDLMRKIYTGIKEEKQMFLQAPTGTGKTLSTLFPALKAVGEGLAGKIFYLTAKTVTRNAAKGGIAALKAEGLKARSIEIVAKGKACFCEYVDCRPEVCPYAKGYYDRSPDVIFDLLSQEEDFYFPLIEKVAKENFLCPFELSLDLSLWCDILLLDYNYAFDPNVRLQRFFPPEEGSNYLFLIDEAHNMVDRAREMYSTELSTKDIMKIKKAFGRKGRSIKKVLDELLLSVLDRDEETVILEEIDAIDTLIEQVIDKINVFMQDHVDLSVEMELPEFFHMLRHFRAMYERERGDYRIYLERREGDAVLSLFCIDTRPIMEERLKDCRASIFFSATLLPLPYYVELLKENDDIYAFNSESAFSKEQRKLLVGLDVTSRYSRRGRAEYEKIASYLISMVGAKSGNYMAFFPSYGFLGCVKEVLDEMNVNFTISEQTQSMSEGERDSFLSSFDEERSNSMLSLCVLGGLFSEGIDLVGDSLLGVAIVGTGLPGLSTRGDILKGYFEDHDKDGFDYACRFPGLNKVLQAAGRVIRSTDDKGVILLLDDRFHSPTYWDLLPEEYDDGLGIRGNDVKYVLEEFWEE